MARRRGRGGQFDYPSHISLTEKKGGCSRNAELMSSGKRISSVKTGTFQDCGDVMQTVIRGKP